jgi:hypothetical protein
MACVGGETPPDGVVGASVEGPPISGESVGVSEFVASTGALVGIMVGAPTSVGMEDTVGVAVGALDTTAVGETEAVGRVEGISDGPSEGIEDGTSDGTREGMSEGISDS